MSSGTNLVMTVIGFTVSVTFIVFVFTRLICARLNMIASRRRSSVTAGRSDLSMLECGRGLDPVIVANFPLRKYSDVFLTPGENIQCTVCLADYHHKDILRFLPICGHFFHAACIDVWLYQHSTCPVCRLSLRDPPERRRFMQPIFSSANRSHSSTRSFNMNSDHSLPNVQRLSPVPCNSQTIEPGQGVCCQCEGSGPAAIGTDSPAANA